jgi:hypothetical protein
MLLEKRMYLFNIGGWYMLLCSLFLILPYSVLTFVGYRGFNIAEMQLPEWIEICLLLISFIGLLLTPFIMAASFFVIPWKIGERDSFIFYVGYLVFLFVIWGIGVQDRGVWFSLIFSVPYINFFRKNHTSQPVICFFVLTNFVNMLTYYFNIHEYFMD